ncbi:LPS-assembly protein LptD [Thalassococcus lentus]|uniref:LPS-assembly protein LptD n=1 Tax=Thalassococcus lentus TaxID=1210524 RepID=A0ABT4XRX9_9RHOB|nr:LPS assembly protein LptD [Thalassococcus lentus]MDA7424696.1 LPS assembly protein LptD [Thalassococcus lentus]
MSAAVLLRFCVLVLTAALIGTVSVQPAFAQDSTAEQTQDDPALLVADEVFVENEERLVASGNVEALQGGIRLSATRIIYDRSTDTLIIEGPIRITDADGNVILADEATLDQGFRNGLLKGARLVLDQQLQLASVEARRVDGRYTQLSRVAVTSCQVCGHNATPLWQIRAKRVVHDQVERQLYFDEAQFRVLDVPVFYLPHLRLPDPTLKRARGFLIPTFHSSTLLGFGIKVPYFIPIGRHQDLTLTPHLSTKARSLGYRYRRAFAYGDLEINGAISSDTLKPGEARGYLFAEGAFRLPRDFKLDFDLKLTSDASYLNDYDITGADRLSSTVDLRRVRRDELITASLVHYESLRDFEDNDTQPTIIGDAAIERRFFPAALGGELRLSAAVHGHYRYSSIPFDSADADLDVDGRDVGRISAEASWRKRWTLAGGIRAGVTTNLWLDRHMTFQDNTSVRDVARATHGVAVELRWPWERTGPRGQRTVIEPLLQLGYVSGQRPGNPNDESTRVEFDEGNLLSLSRFPAADRREHGGTVAAGLRWMHQAPDGWSAALTIGRIWRETADTEFTRSSGLQGTASDWLVAGRFAHQNGLTLSARGLLDDQARFSKAEARAGWSNNRMDLGASYVLLVTDPDEDRLEAQSEWSFDGEYRISQHWSTSTSWRYDLVDRRLDRVGLGLQYQNECVQVDFGATRKFASSSNLEPSTDFDLTVALKGFSTGGSAKEFRRTCQH